MAEASSQGRTMGGYICRAKPLAAVGRRVGFVDGVRRTSTGCTNSSRRAYISASAVRIAYPMIGWWTGRRP